jgi:hypothetical protein
MDFALNAVEARMLGCLIEKERTTPEYYPLTLNALIAACNQKSNRDPEMQLDEPAVSKALDTLRLKGLVYLSHTAGGRAPKYAHQVEKFFTFTPREFGILCLLLLRGPQTPGELRSRADRLCPFASPAEVETVLQELVTRPGGPFVVKLARQPGQSAARYAHLLSGPVDVGESAAAPAAQPSAPAASADHDRLSALEKDVAILRGEIAQLKQQLGIAPATDAAGNPAADGAVERD